MTVLVVLLMLAVPALLAVWVVVLRRRLTAAQGTAAVWRLRCWEIQRSTPDEIRLAALLRQAREERDEHARLHEELRASLHDRYQARREEREMAR